MFDFLYSSFIWYQYLHSSFKIDPPTTFERLNSSRARHRQIFQSLIINRYSITTHNIVILMCILCVFTRQPRGPMRMRSGCFERGSALAGDRAPSEDASIKSMDTSSWPPTWDNQPTAHIAEILSGRKHKQHILVWPSVTCCFVSLKQPPLCVCVIW